MGKLTGFLDYQRMNDKEDNPEHRVSSFEDFHTPLNDEQRRKQAARCMNCGIPFCQSGMVFSGKSVGCPLNNLIPEFNHLIYLGLFEEAYKRLAKTAPFPEFTGSVCPALCEACCSCSIDDDSVTVRANELFLISKAFENQWIRPKKDIVRNGKTAAVIGSGPAGLSCARELNYQGFSVTVFEKNDRFGGLLMYGIPNMKLDKSLIDRRIWLLKDEGITFVNNTKIGKDYSMEKLREDYDEIIFACGTSLPRSLTVPNASLDGIIYAVDFLSQCTRDYLDGKPFHYDLSDKDVVVVGGGDTGNDCLATLTRLKARTINLLEIMKEPPSSSTLPWPNYPDKKKNDYGVIEANLYQHREVRHYQTTVDEITGDGHIEGIYTRKVEFKNGKFVPVSDEREYYPCSLLIIAMGFAGTDDDDLTMYKLNSRNHRVILNDFYYDDQISVCGDMKNGQSLVVKAIKDGLDCARFIASKYVK